MAAGKFEVSKAVGYIIAQMLGAMTGAAIVYGFYRAHFIVSENADDKLACFCTAPNLPGTTQALFCEAVGTFVLVFAILMSEAPIFENMLGSDNIKPPTLGLGSLGLVPVALMVFGIGLSLGGTTGYAINPARDLGPRIVHFLLPIPGKRDSDWEYSWIPVAGPIVGAVVAATIFLLTKSM